MTAVSRGVVYVATGAPHVAAARASAASVRRSNPGLAIAIFSDDPAPGPEFDIVLGVREAHARAKVDLLGETPFAETLYLDTDTRVLSDLADLFRLLERFDLAAAQVRRGHLASYLREYRHAVPAAFPQLNTGVLLFRMRPEVADLFAAWRDAYHAAGFGADQVTFRDTVWGSAARITVLPAQYNLRRHTWLDHWFGHRRARPVILHTNRFHPLKQGGGIARRLRSLVGPAG